MNHLFILIYGLPGSGKSTLCDELGKRDDIFYCNLSTHPEFNTMPVRGILSQRLRKTVLDRPMHILTEGCFPNRNVRAELLAPYKRHRKIVTIYLKESCLTLSQRRVRSVKAYKQLRAREQISTKCITIDTPNLVDRLRQVVEIIKQQSSPISCEQTGK